MAGMPTGLLDHVGERPSDARRPFTWLRPRKRCSEISAPVEYLSRSCRGFAIVGEYIGDAVR